MPPGNTPPSDHTGFGPPFQPPPGPPGAPVRRRAGLFLTLAAIVALGIVAVVLVVDRGGAAQRKSPTESGASTSRAPAPSLGIPTGLPTALPSKLPSDLPARLPSGWPSVLPSGFPSDLESLFAVPAVAPSTHTEVAAVP
ncbi:hypothetical protein [Streptomyces sp. Y2F8-2]|uniref:hypothetical protein n=1 Tax=Streptomyces sp. Y2F8-2 TaxID=2759675 RepID=UPI00190611FC|nr:hypothetical protein [Streptomyces sp. Y2F8-2]